MSTKGAFVFSRYGLRGRNIHVNVNVERSTHTGVGEIVVAVYRQPIAKLLVQITQAGRPILISIALVVSRIGRLSWILISRHSVGENARLAGRKKIGMSI